MKSNKSHQERLIEKPIIAEMLLIMVTLFWGSTFFLVKATINYIPVFAFLSIRFTLATIIVLPFALNMRKHLNTSLKNNATKGSIVGLTLWASFTFQTIGLQFTSSTVAAFITGMSVIMAPIFGYFFFNTWLNRITLIGAALAFIGVTLLSGIIETNPEKLLNSNLLLGNILVFICAIAVAFHILYTEKYTPDVDLWVFLSFQIAVAAGLSIISSAITAELNFEYFNPLNWNLIVWTTLFITVIFATVIAYLVQSYYQGKEIVSAARVALIFSFEPVFAALTGFIFLHEILTITGVIGAILIFSAMIISHINSTTKHSSKQT